MSRKLALRESQRGALDLRHFWLEQIEYKEADEAPEEFDEPTTRISRPVLKKSASEANTYLMTLRIRTSQADVRSMDLTICGVFQLKKDDDGNDGTEKMLVYNGTAMLYGSARGIVETVTGLTGFGRLRLPSANIAKLLSGK